MALLDIVKPGNQIGQGTLPPHRADQGHDFTGTDIEADILEYPLLAVAERDVLKA